MEYDLRQLRLNSMNTYAGAGFGIAKTGVNPVICRALARIVFIDDLINSTFNSNLSI